MTRADVLLRLVQKAAPNAQLWAELQAVPPAGERRGVALGPEHLLPVLRACVRGQCPAAELSDWAALLRRCADVEPTDARVKDIVFALADPEIHDALTPMLAAEWVRQLEADG